MSNRAEEFARRQETLLPGEMGIEWDEVTAGRAVGRFTAQKKHMAPNGFMHAAAVIALVDSACGYGCIASLPEGAANFTTIELKANYLSTAREGEHVSCLATLLHGGRSTQVWDAVATNETTGKAMAVFRCTQMVLYPR
jgi:uncharacterized protein (TIGR00369 family)